MQVAPTRQCLKAGFGKAEAGLCLLVLLYAAGGAVLAAKIGQLQNFRPLFYSDLVGHATIFIGLCFLGARIFYVMAVRHPRRLTMFLARDLRDFLVNNDRLARALPIFLCFTVFISVFSSMKAMIPAVHPFVWDERLMRLDRALHGGTDPWSLLQPVLGYPPVTSAINVAYNGWFLVMFAVLYWQMFSIGSPKLRMRFFYAFILNWILNGTVLAMVFSSAGPCFYHAVTGSDYYEPLMAYLRQAASRWPVPALETQDMLWRSYTEPGIRLGVGISAMPSVHVSSAFLFMLLGWKAGRRTGIPLTVFFLLILVGSVHLAWHYAIDGYAGCAVAALLWAGLPRLLGRDLPVQAAKGF